MDGRSQIKVHTDERTQVHSAQSSLAVTHPSTNQARRYNFSDRITEQALVATARTSDNGESAKREIFLISTLVIK